MAGLADLARFYSEKRLIWIAATSFSQGIYPSQDAPVLYGISVLQNERMVVRDENGPQLAGQDGIYHGTVRRGAEDIWRRRSVDQNSARSGVVRLSSPIARRREKVWLLQAV